MQRTILFLLIVLLGGASVARAQERLYGLWGIPFGSSRADVKRQMASRPNGVLQDEQTDFLLYTQCKFAEEYDVRVLFNFVDDQLYTGSIFFDADNWEETTLFLMGYLQLLYSNTEQFTNEPTGSPRLRSVVRCQFKNDDQLGLFILQTPEGTERGVMLVYKSDSLNRVKEAEERRGGRAASGGGATESGQFRKCSYEGPELSFGFLYPADMEERPTVRPHVKRMVVGADGFSFLVGLYDFGSALADLERELGEPVEELVKDDEILLKFLFGEGDYGRYNPKISRIERGFTIDGLPATFVEMTLEGRRMDRVIKMTNWNFVLFYHNVMVNLVGGTATGVADSDRNFERFKYMAGTFSVTSQYPDPGSASSK